MTRKPLADIASGRLPDAELGQNFADVCPPLDAQRALIEADRCYYCYDAPCIQACPTSINIPSFIKRIATDNLRGAATTILSANIFGGSCARVCPTEILCEGACVRNTQEDKPVEIGMLQRYATDWVYPQNAQLFQRAPDTGLHVAVVGAGPAGLACAHALSLQGHQVTVFDALAKPGGLNEYGIAAYKVPDFVQREIDWLLSIGGIEIRHGHKLGSNLGLDELRGSFAAVFIAVGLNAVHALGMQGETSAGVSDAVDFIAALRQAPRLSEVTVGRRVVIIGGGNTAIDACVQSKKLGADLVTLVYRRGPEQMSATCDEQAFAQTAGVKLLYWAQPTSIESTNGALSEVVFEHTQLGSDGRLQSTGEGFILQCDVLLKAIGQALELSALSGAEAPLHIHNGRIVVDANYATSQAGVWAGGDCVGGKVDLTVQAVEDGKRAARAIHQALTQRN